MRIRCAAAALLLLLLTSAVRAQSMLAISPRQCVWRSGDDPVWATPDLDESAWQPYTDWRLNPNQPRLWVRCHLGPIAATEFDRPSVQIRLSAAYQLFMNGTPIGHNGDLRRGFFSMDFIQVFPFPPSLVGNRSNILSLRIVQRFASLGTSGSLQALEIRVGPTQTLRDNRAGVLVLSLHPNLITFVPLVVLGIVGLVLLGFSVLDRKHPEPILLGLSCVFLGLMFMNTLCGSMMTNEPVWAYLVVYSLTATANMLVQTSFYFVLARKRISAAFRLLIGAWVVCAAWQLAALLLPPQQALPLDALRNVIIEPISIVLLALLLGISPFVAFWPYHRIPARMRALAALSAAWGAILLAFFVTLGANEVFANRIFLQTWQAALFPAQSIVQACVVAALIALVVRDQRQIADQRSVLAGEMEAAQKIQRALIPASIDSLAGYRIEIAFCPALEVGGDFYSCRILSTGRQRILLGDVSGKGVAAAMTAAVLLGAAERREKDIPVELLRHLNLVLSEMRLGGFATCLCGDISVDGTLVLANAGHIPPYLSGDEMKVDPSLPLGLAADFEYTETRLQLAPGDTLTFLSDGVVEARSQTGELFGFDRMRAISSRSAEHIAQAAQTFGQDDDITVLTVTFVPAEVLHG
jgi:hypothetical protein